jgi:hypothetical protein
LREAHPDQVITRNFYRVHGQYAESAWSAHAGTFAEFKKHGGHHLSRHAHGIERSATSPSTRPKNA